MCNEFSYDADSEWGKMSKKEFESNVFRNARKIADLLGTQADVVVTKEKTPFADLEVYVVMGADVSVEYFNRVANTLYEFIYEVADGADIKERKNKTALMNFFISHNQGDIVRYLIERGYDIYRGNPTKWYGSLSVAASRGNLEIFKYLFEETGKNDKKCHKIKLFCGIYYGTVDIVKYVIDNMDVDDEKYVKRIMER